MKKGRIARPGVGCEQIRGMEGHPAWAKAQRCDRARTEKVGTLSIEETSGRWVWRGHEGARGLIPEIDEQ